MSLIDAVLSSLVEELENALQAVSARPGRWIAFGPPGRGASDRSGPGGDIRAMVLSIDGDAALGRFDARRSDAAAAPVEGPPPLMVDVQVAFVSDVRPEDYLVGLGMISEVIALMQERPVLTVEIPHGRAREAVRLPVELVALDVDRRSRAAAMLGAVGQVFVIYRLRRLPCGGASFGAVASRVGGAGAARR